MTKPMLTELFARGYAVLPTPQSAQLDGATVTAAAGFSISLAGVKPKDIAVDSLQEQLAARTGLPAATAAGKGRLEIKLAIEDKSVAADQPEGIRKQGYLLVIGAAGVALTGNSPAGLFYGVQTLVQLLKFAPGVGWTLPAGRIEDWPDLELRTIHYDTKHHQETLDGVKRIIERAAHFKIGGIVWEIEDKFAYRSHPLIGAPGAFTGDEMRELTEFALARYVEIVPILQMPSHNAFIGKHKKYARLREHPTNNYMLCPSNPKTRALYKELLTELVEATPGCRYIHLGTDEPYFLGQGSDCDCRKKMKTMTTGAIEAEMLTDLAGFLAAKGRTAMYWGEHPLTPADIPLMPPNTINTILMSPAMSKAYKAQGIQEVIYTPTQGVRLFFPDYWRARSGMGSDDSRLITMTRQIRNNAHREDNVLGSLIGAWDDSGLNNETFWLGWAGASSVAWNIDGADPDEMASTFFAEFYGPSACGMEDVYRLMHEVADFWVASWDRVPSSRGPSFMRKYHPRLELTLALPNVPDPVTLNNRPFWRKHYADLLAKADLVEVFFGRLFGLLHGNMLKAERERFNLEVLLSIAKLLGHQLTLLRTLAAVESALDAARQAWDRVQPGEALDNLKSAGRRMSECIKDRESLFESLKLTWEKARKPKGAKVDRKKFVHIQDDTKNHTADHTADLSYLIEAQRGLGLEAWVERLDGVAGEFAAKFGAMQGEPDYMMD